MTVVNPKTRLGSAAMEARVQRVLIWMGPGMIVLWFGSFLVLAGFIPPSSPADSAAKIVRLYADNTDAIKLGLVIGMAGSALLVPWAVAISGQVKRIPGARALGDTQMVSCALLSLEFITPIAVWMVASYRFDDRDPEITRTLQDAGWILFVAVIWSVWVQMVCIAAAIFIDHGDEPVLPRWLGYLNAWCALLIMPAGLVLFFHHGAFTWNGAIGFFVPLVGYLTWMLGTTYAVYQALGKQMRENTEPA